MAINEAEILEKQKEIQNVNLEYTKQAGIVGEKTWLIEKFKSEIPSHHEKMQELDKKAALLRQELAEIQQEKLQAPTVEKKVAADV